MAPRWEYQEGVVGYRRMWKRFSCVREHVCTYVCITGRPGLKSKLHHIVAMWAQVHYLSKENFNNDNTGLGD